MSNIKWANNYLLNYNKTRFQNKMSDEVLFRALENITMPYDLSEEFYVKQDLILKDILSKKQIIDVNDLKPIKDNIYLFKGDITLIKADAIVNACNKKMLGCFVPGHHCIDNAIHSFAGLEVRRDMMRIMEEQGYDEPNGKCKVTKGYNLPAKYIFHTVGPIYNGSGQNNIDLRNCYYSCMKMADDMRLESIVFCSLSTGVFGFPIDKASDIAINTVNKYLKEENKNIKKVIFNVFSDKDYNVYYNNINELLN